MASSKQAAFAKGLVEKLDKLSANLSEHDADVVETVVRSCGTNVVRLIGDPDSIDSRTASAVINTLLQAVKLATVVTPEQQSLIDWALTLPNDGFLASVSGQFARKGSLSDRQWEALENAHHKATAAPDASAPAKRDLTDLLGDVPDGLYAFESRTGNNDLDFWIVSTNQGRSNPANKGKRWLARFVGGQGSVNVSPAERNAVAQFLTEQSHDALVAAMALFGREVGKCGKCGKSLTDEESRARGLGPTCASGDYWAA